MFLLVFYKFLCLICTVCQEVLDEVCFVRQRDLAVFGREFNGRLSLSSVLIIVIIALIV